MNIQGDFWFGALVTFTLMAWGIWLGVGYDFEWRVWPIVATLGTFISGAIVVSKHLE